MRINKFPFFLWLTNEREDFKLDVEKQEITSEELGKSTIKKVPIFLVVLMKYFPLAFLSYFFFIPRNLFEVGLLFIALFVVLVLFALLNYEVIFKVVLIGICVINFYFVFTIPDYASPLSTAITLFAELLIITIVLYDIFILKGYQNWYFLEDFKNEINIRFSQKKEKKILFFWKRRVGLHTNKKVYIKGYFLRITDENFK